MAILLVLAILLSGVTGYFIGNSINSQKTITTATTFSVTDHATAIFPTTTTIVMTDTTTETRISQGPTVTFSQTSLEPGLQLDASVFPENTTVGQNVSILSEVYNSLPHNVTVNAISIVNPSIGPCAFGQAIAVSVYPGYYSFANVSSATSLLLYNASLIFLCPAASNSTYTFLPNSDSAIVQYQAPFSSSPFPEMVNLTTNIGGYWNKSGTGGFNGTNYEFQYFNPGIYTVLVSDAWSQEVICYFRISS